MPRKVMSADELISRINGGAKVLTDVPESSELKALSEQVKKLSGGEGWAHVVKMLQAIAVEMRRANDQTNQSLNDLARLIKEIQNTQYTYQMERDGAGRLTKITASPKGGR